MSKAQSHPFTLTCTECAHSVEIPFRSLETFPVRIICPKCKQHYGFDDATIIRQMKQFITLCKEIYASEEILSTAAIAVRVGAQEVKIPFKVLLTRLRSTFDVTVGGKKCLFSYRTEPKIIAETVEKELIESTL